MDRLRAVGERVRDLAQQSAFLRRWWKELLVLLALLIILAAPFLLRPSDNTAPSRYDRRLVILTPHNDKIRHEFGIAFSRHWKETRGETLYVDWRVAGTSELALMLRSDFTAAFQYDWVSRKHLPWSSDVAAAFMNPKLTVSASGTAALPPDQQARKSFLESDVGIGADLLFGGGSFDFEQQAKAGTIVSADAAGNHGIKALFKEQPQWFSDAAIPQSLSGETFYDREQRWVGTCLSSMGIVFNRDVLRRLGIEQEPRQWADLADPRYSGQIALSDPNKSGTVTKALEQIIQQQMQLAIAELRARPESAKLPEKDLIASGVATGWDRGLRLIQRICANSRYFTDQATKIPLEVSQGDAAAGMCVDFYGRSFEEQCRQPDGSTRVGFVTPYGGASVSVDPIAMLRGAREPEAATEFMKFVLSDEGQSIWNFQFGTPGGPVHTSLRRLPVRKDFYTEVNRRSMTDGSAQPYVDAQAFVYHPEWTGSLFGVIRFLVRVMSIDVHEEQRHAWNMLIRRDFPSRAVAVFEDLKLMNYAAAQQLAVELGRKDKELEVKKARELSTIFRAQYDRTHDLARRGQ